MSGHMPKSCVKCSDSGRSPDEQSARNGEIQRVRASERKGTAWQDTKDDRHPKWLLHRLLPDRASRDRPPMCWTDYAREDSESLKLLLNWAQVAWDRE